LRGKIFTTLASANHIHRFLHLPSSGSHAVAGELGQLLWELWYKTPSKFTAERVQTKVFQMLSKSSQKAIFPGYNKAIFISLTFNYR